MCCEVISDLWFPWVGGGRGLVSQEKTFLLRVTFFLCSFKQKWQGGGGWTRTWQHFSVVTGVYLYFPRQYISLEE